MARFEIEAHKHLYKLEGVGNYFNYNKTVDKGKFEDQLHREHIYKTAYKWAKDWPDRKKHIEDLLGIKIPTKHKETDPGMKFVIDSLKEAAYLNSVESMKARLTIEMIEAFKNEWYMIFNTMTVDPEHYEEIFEKESKAWRNYIRKIERDLAETIYGSYRNSKGHNFFNYMAVIEEGESTGRLHIHCMLFMKNLIPVKDPNYGINPPARKEIDEYCEYWPYGHSQFIPIRFSNSDPYGKRGWVWPIDKTGQPIPSSSIEKIASYMTKYIMKSKENQGGQTWRTKTTRTMGLMSLKIAITNMAIKPLMSIVKYSKTPQIIMLYNNQVPTKLIRILAVKELVQRLRRKQVHLRSSDKNTTLKTLMQHGIQTKLDRKSTNIGDSLLRLFNGKATSSVWEKHFNEAKKQLETAMPAETYIEPASGGNIDNR